MSIKLTNAMLIDLVLQSHERGVKHGEIVERVRLQEQRDKLATLENERTQALVERLSSAKREVESWGDKVIPRDVIMGLLTSLDPRPSPGGDPKNAGRYPTMFKEKI